MNKHEYSSININVNVFDTGLNKGLYFIVQLIMVFHGYIEEFVLLDKKEQNR